MSFRILQRRSVYSLSFVSLITVRLFAW